MSSSKISKVDLPVRFCIVGSGPAGFYTAQQLLKELPKARIDMYEALPIPYGLVRFGVAPDHPEVKNVTHKFDQLAQSERFRFIGNVKLGKDVTVDELKEHYHGIILSYGAGQDRKLGLDREDIIKNVFPARVFVNWYNGLPSYAKLNPDLVSGDSAVIVGQGNVALDIARILLAPISYLKTTDIAEHAIELLKKSNIKHVHVVGRRGPLQVSFTTKEFRELLSLPNVRINMDSDCIQSAMATAHEDLAKDRPRKRLIDIMAKTALESKSRTEDGDPKTLHLHFLKSPVELESAPVEGGDGESISGVKFELNELIKNDKSIVAKGSGRFETINCSILLKSIGYKSTSVEGLPFDDKRGIIPNERGRVVNMFNDEEPVEGVYVAGWLKRGPSGVIATTMFDAFETAATIIKDIESQKPFLHGLHSTLVDGFEGGILPLLKSRDVVPVFYEDWKLVEQEEERRGKTLGKPREKIVDLDEILKIAKNK